VVQLLLDHGADIDSGQYSVPAETPIACAVIKGHGDIVTLLLDKKANIATDCLRSPLTYAAEYGQIKIVQQLIERKVDVNHCALLNWPALQYASYHGHAAIVNLLLANNADVNAQANVTCGSTTALHHAAENDYTEIARTLIEHKASIDTADKYYEKTAFYKAVKNKHFSVAQLLLQHMIPTERSKNASKELGVATKQYDQNMVKLLIDSRASQAAQASALQEVQKSTEINRDRTEIIRMLTASSASS